MSRSACQPIVTPSTYPTRIPWANSHVHKMKCVLRDDSGWVCENHPKRAWEGEHAGGCGGIGAPCPACNSPAPDDTPRLPDGFKTIIDKDGWRH